MKLLALMALAALVPLAPGEAGAGRRAHIDSYGVTGTTVGGAVVRGRAYRGRPVPSAAGRGKMAKTVESGRLLRRRPLKNAKVEVTVDGKTHHATTDARGFFDVTVPVKSAGQKRVEVKVSSGRRSGESSMSGRVYEKGSGGEALIVDWDNTAAENTGAIGDKWQVVLRAMVRSDDDFRMARGAVEELRNALSRGPVAIVSASPAKIAPKILRLLKRNGLRSIPIFLRDNGDKVAKQRAKEAGENDVRRYKLSTLSRLVDTVFSGWRARLIGDNETSNVSGDPETFRQFASERPGTVDTLIRDIRGDGSGGDSHRLFQEWSEVASP